MVAGSKPDVMNTSAVRKTRALSRSVALLGAWVAASVCAQSKSVEVGVLRLSGTSSKCSAAPPNITDITETVHLGDLLPEFYALLLATKPAP